VNSEGAFLTTELCVLNKFYFFIKLSINSVVDGTINN